MVQRNVEWYCIRKNSVALREMAQCNVEGYSVHTNAVELREMAWRNVEWPPSLPALVGLNMFIVLSNVMMCIKCRLSSSIFFLSLLFNKSSTSKAL